MSIEAWLIKDGMTSLEIKIHLLRKGLSIEKAADQIGEPRSQVSATIHYLRLNQRIREKLLEHFGIRFSPRIQLRQEEKQAA